MQINLDDFIPGSVHFRWKEAIYCKEWRVCVFPSDDQVKEIIKVASIMDSIRNSFGKPVVIHSWLRPPVYNKLINGAPQSWHMKGGAVDFSITTLNCDEVRASLVKLLDHLNIRMERLDGSNWIHIDTRPIPYDGNRYFYASGSLG
jgi:hypothetical protein